ncbi:hypothetical protein FALCPG4_004615 [Fusarium falciforme]
MEVQSINPTGPWQDQLDHFCRDAQLRPPPFSRLCQIVEAVVLRGQAGSRFTARHSMLGTGMMARTSTTQERMPLSVLSSG